MRRAGLFIIHILYYAHPTSRLTHLSSLLPLGAEPLAAGGVREALASKLKHGSAVRLLRGCLMVYAQPDGDGATHCVARRCLTQFPPTKQLTLRKKSRQENTSLFFIYL